MRFYDREKEISRLRKIEQASRNNAQLTVVTGRRRIGKTQLILKSTELAAEPILYFFVARKAENIDLDVLRDKGVHFLRATGELKDYKITYLGLSMENM